MPWTSCGTRRYFSESVRIDGRVVRRYLGAGPAAHEAAAAIERRRAERIADAHAAQQAKQRHAEGTAPLDDLCRATDLLVNSTLVRCGYHQHDRSWRKIRDRAHNAQPLPGNQPRQNHGDSGAGYPG